MTIIAYKYLHHPYYNNTFEPEVNKLISEGWQPYGFPTILGVEGIGTYVSQAMVKYEPKEKPSTEMYCKVNGKPLTTKHPDPMCL